MGIEKMRAALIQAVEVIKDWHGEEAFDIYYKHSPEMKLIREALLENEPIIQADAGLPCGHDRKFTVYGSKRVYCSICDRTA